MKKKSPRGIPDFARHAPTAKHADGTHEPLPSSTRIPRRAQAPARVKPQATSAKSGQRGT